jgi:hypothetical protein
MMEMANNYADEAHLKRLRKKHKIQSWVPREADIHLPLWPKEPSSAADKMQRFYTDARMRGVWEEVQRHLPAPHLWTEFSACALRVIFLSEDDTLRMSDLRRNLIMPFQKHATSMLALIRKHVSSRPDPSLLALSAMRSAGQYSPADQAIFHLTAGADRCDSLREILEGIVGADIKNIPPWTSGRPEIPPTSRKRHGPGASRRLFEDGLIEFFEANTATSQAALVRRITEIVFSLEPLDVSITDAKNRHRQRKRRRKRRP